jgi:hypothetical protein
MKISETVGGGGWVVFILFAIIWLCEYCVPRPLTQSTSRRGVVFFAWSVQSAADYNKRKELGMRAKE